jgi:hypothetical protein
VTVTQVRYSSAGRSRGQVVLCAVCTVHMETRSTGFLVEAQNQGRWLVSCLASKPLGWVFQFGPQNWPLWFGDLGLKITMTVSSFGPQNHVGFSLSVVPQNRWREDGVLHVSRSGSLLHLEASHARVSQSGLKTGGGAMVGGAHGTITEVASGSS